MKNLNRRQFLKLATISITGALFFKVHKTKEVQDFEKVTLPGTEWSKGKGWSLNKEESERVTAAFINSSPFDFINADNWTPGFAADFGTFSFHLLRHEDQPDWEQVVKDIKPSALKHPVLVTVDVDKLDRRGALITYKWDRGVIVEDETRIEFEDHKLTFTIIHRGEGTTTYEAWIKAPSDFVGEV